MDQELALEIMLAGHNAFLTGAAGAGKTHTLNEFIRLAKKAKRKVAVTATTGIAATHLGGSTIHAWSGMGVLDALPHNFFDKMSKGRREQIEKAQVLVIDEISMLHDFHLDLVDEICRTVRADTRPFGGLQVVLCGDFFQLPPVTRRNWSEEAQSDEPPRTGFAYHANCWRDLNLAVLYLNSQHRQDDDGFLEILNKIRSNSIVRSDAEKIVARHRAKLEGFKEVTELYTTNRNVDAVNERKMAKLPEKFVEYEMTHTGSADYYERMKRSCLAPEVLKLKKGALVMALKNDPEQGFVNGSIGVITGFGGPLNHPIVKFRNGREIMVKEVSWELRDGDVKRASITQIPLRPAYAITIHKSQGMTLDAARIDLKNVFEMGMGYVALSRVRSLDALSIIGLHGNAFKVHPEVLQKDGEFQKQCAQTKKSFEHLRDRAKKRAVETAANATKPKAATTKNPERAAAWAEKLARMRKVYPHAYTAWSKADDEKLSQLFKEGRSVKELSAEFGRHTGAIRKRLEKLFGEGVV
ncbi:MAG: AAA family ATPase [Candidatus Nomurabacteria bacterium]|jgi:ATP-dependent exoDNAse (exonuclease V) alpha subunit|nr:AAA family ATPase [Candidatus Nomurabacteria bacterium]